MAAAILAFKRSTPWRNARSPVISFAMSTDPSAPAPSAPSAGVRPEEAGAAKGGPKKLPAETGGPKGPEPTRFGDWERNGRCVDF